jgi:hypothetical protein
MHEGAGAPLMHPQPDQPDPQREGQVTSRHAPLHSRSQLTTRPPGSVLAASQERLAPARSAAATDPPGQPDPGPAEPGPAEPGAGRLREHLETVRLHAQRASSWLETSSHYARLVNRDGVVPVTARFSLLDLAFLGEAREGMLSFADLGLRLIELHQPLDAGGPASGPSAVVLRCRSCMWRWPCPTFRTLAEVLDGIRPGNRPARPTSL